MARANPLGSIMNSDLRVMGNSFDALYMCVCAFRSPDCSRCDVFDKWNFHECNNAHNLEHIIPLLPGDRRFYENTYI